MIICICNHLNDATCAAAIDRPGCRSVGCVYRQLGCRIRCGRCVPTMAALFRKLRHQPLPAENDTTMPT